MRGGFFFLSRAKKTISTPPRDREKGKKKKKNFSSTLTLGQRLPKVPEQPRSARLPVVRVDLQRAVHPDGKALLRRVQRLARRVGPRVPDDQQALLALLLAALAPSERVDRVRDQHHVLVPAHQLALARRAADHQAVDAGRELRGDERVVAVEVDAAVGEVGGLDGGDQAVFCFLALVLLLDCW